MGTDQAQRETRPGRRSSLERRRDEERKKKTRAEYDFRGNEISGHSDEQIGHVGPPREYFGRVVQKIGICDGHADDSLELPFPAKLALAGAIVAGEDITFLPHVTTQRFHEKRHDNLAAVQRRVHTLAGERIEEIRRVANERGPRSPRTPRRSGKGAGRANGRYSLRDYEALGEVRTRRNPAFEELGLVSNLLR